MKNFIAIIGLLLSFVSFDNLVLAQIPSMLDKNISPYVKDSKITLELPPTPNNIRNSEGAFIELKDGTIAYMYSRYVGDNWADDAPADIAARYSCDMGKTWTSDDVIVVKNPSNGNVMSVSLLRLQNGEIAMLYLLKTRERDGRINCMPFFRYSCDETKTWSEPIPCIPERFKNYYVVNNDRLVQLKNGRLICPAAFHRSGESRGIAYVYYSDDNGRTWKESDWILPPNPKSKTGLQESGVIELQNGDLMLWARSDQKYQYKAFSKDNGKTWSQPQIAKEFPSPTAPLSIKRNPVDNALIAIWCDKSTAWNFKEAKESSWGRTPLVLAISRDEGKSWTHHTALETDEKSGFCYTAMFFANDDSILIAYCCGGVNYKVLQPSRIRKLKLYK